MKKSYIFVLLFVAAVPFLMACSKSDSSKEEKQSETFHSINAQFLYAHNSTPVPETVILEVGSSMQIYIGNGATKAIFNGPVKWTATGAGDLSLSAVQRTASAEVFPLTKAWNEYNTSNATTNATTNLKITGKSDGIVTLKAVDPIGTSIFIVVNVYPKD